MASSLACCRIRDGRFIEIPSLPPICLLRMSLVTGGLKADGSNREEKSSAPSRSAALPLLVATNFLPVELEQG